MSSEDYWSDCSEINYIDWENIEKMYTAEKISDQGSDSCQSENTTLIPEKDDNYVYKMQQHSESDMEESSDVSVQTNLTDESEWSSNDDRWEMNLAQLKRKVRNQQLIKVLEGPEWNTVENINLQKINELMKENIFPESPCQNTNEEANDNSNDACVNQSNYQSIPSEEVVSSSDEYIPSRGDMNISDSNSSIHTPRETYDSEGFIDVISRRRKRQMKKKGKALFCSTSAATAGQRGSKAAKFSALDEAKNKSLQEAKKRREATKSHGKRLDILLKSNGLQRDHVPAQGNCFFDAVSRQTTENIDALELREQICNHLQSNLVYYSDFFATQSENIANEIATLRQPGCWATNLSDILPLAIANQLAVKVKIYSSSSQKSVITLVPTLVDIPVSETKELILAYLNIPGYEHYDSVSNRPAQSSESELESYVSEDNTTADVSMESIPFVSNTDEGENDSDNLSTPIKHQSPKEYTPRMQAKYQSPLRKKLTRKRQANPGNWKKNVRKHNVQTGKEYTSVTGKTVDAKFVKPHSCTKCRFNCADKIDEATRQSLFDKYWNLQSYERQRDFICSRVLERNSLGSPTKKKKQVARTFTFQHKGQSIRVCKQFFISTLGIGRKTVETALKKKRSTASPIKDKRGRHTPHNRTPIEDIDIVHQHIQSFPVVDSHYSRKDSNRKYLSADLSIRKMYDLYKAECQNAGRKCVKEYVYRNIFCSEYNLSFHKPKKDQCIICNNFNQMTELGTLNDEAKKNYDQHQERKIQGRQEKQNDKDKSKTDKSFVAATFDLEAVLSTPCSLVSQAYYKRKLSCYNLSIYSLGDNIGTCYLWNETDGERGSCEIATCLNKYISSLPPYVKHVSLFSDNCMGQNRNKFVTTALLYNVANNRNVKIIDQKFLETGHTHMECDSMHAAIEHAKKKTSIYIPSQWDTVIRMARRNNPYTVIPLKFWDIIDYKCLQKENFKNFETNSVGEKVRWRDIKHLQFRQDTPGVIYYKYNYAEVNFYEIKCKLSTRGRQKSLQNVELPAKYDNRLAISLAKKEDLLSLCRANVIPADCKQFYECIPTCKSKKDRLPEPDIEEDEFDSE